MSLEEYADKFRVRNLYVPEQLYGKLAKLENIAEQERMRSEATDKRSEVLQESGPGDGPGSGSGATLIQSSDPNGPDRGEPNAETSFFATTTKVPLLAAAVAGPVRILLQYESFYMNPYLITGCFKTPNYFKKTIF